MQVFVLHLLYYTKSEVQGGSLLKELLIILPSVKLAAVEEKTRKEKKKNSIQ